MPNDAYEYMKMLLNVNKNAKIVIECELHANVRFLALMNASSRYWSSINANECVFSRNNSKRCIVFSTVISKPHYCAITGAVNLKMMMQIQVKKVLVIRR